MQIEKDVVWTQKISKSLAWKVYQSYVESWIQTKSRRSYLLVKHSASRRIIALLVYVDDIIVIGDDIKEIEKFKRCLMKEFEIKELGKVKYFLSI